GCAAVPELRRTPAFADDETRIVSLCGDVSEGIGEWEWEFRSHGVRGRLVFVGVHGGSDGAQWITGPDEPFGQTAMKKIIAGVKKANPGFKIVLLSCNAARFRIDEPGVYYARRLVQKHPHTGENETPPRA